MAVAINTVGVNTADVGTWNASDVITLLEEQLKWLGWHGDTDYGLVCGISSIIVGNNKINASTDAYYNAEPTSTTGVGEGFSLLADRSTSLFDASGITFSGELATFQVNKPGKNYVGGEIVTIPGSEFANPSAPDAKIQLVVDATISGAVSYAVTFTGEYNASGTDRNGVVSGQGTTITIKEGDTINLTANMSSSVYEIAIIRGDEWGSSSTSAGTTNYVFNSEPWNYIDGNSGSTYSWETRWGDRGTYYVRPYNSTFYSATIPTIIVEPADAGSITTTGYGSTNTFYDKNLNGNNSWGIWKDVIDSNKKYGTTFRSFAFDNNASTLVIASGSSYNPIPFIWGGTGYSLSFTSKSGGMGYGRNFRGSPYLDWTNDTIFNSGSSPSSNLSDFCTNYSISVSTGGNTTYELNLIVYRSSIDPNFAVFSFYAPTLSSTNFDGNTFGTFWFSRYTTTLWDLDYLFLSGCNYIDGGGSSTVTTDPYIGFFCSYQGALASSDIYASKRSAEFGFNQMNSSEVNSRVATNYYESLAYDQTIGTGTPKLYYRPGGTDKRTMGGNNYGTTATDKLDPETDFNAVVKGIPIQCTWLPCPYYLPDDFVLINFKYNQVNANIQQGDTITISGSEVYKIIEASYNQSTTTSGIAFCARIV